MNSELDQWRKKLLWRATHRGIKEMDIIVGRFAHANLPHMDQSGLTQFETILDIPDQDLLEWITDQAEVPAGQSSDLLRALLRYRPS